MYFVWCTGQGLQVNLNCSTDVITFRDGTRKFVLSFLMEFHKGVRCEGVYQTGVQQM